MTAPYYQDDLLQRGVEAMLKLAEIDTLDTPRSDADYVRAILEAVSQQSLDFGNIA